MGKLTPRLVSSQGRTPERQRLADAIERRNAAKAERKRIQHALDRHWEETFASERDLEAAERDLAELKVSEEAVLAAAYLGDAEAASLADAQKAVDGAKAAVEQADKARAGLRDRIRDAEAKLDIAEKDLQSAYLAARDVDPAIARLHEQGEDLLRKFVAHLRVRRLVESALGDYRWSSIAPIIEAAFPGLPHSEREEQWQAALAQLREDADTRLPAP